MFRFRGIPRRVIPAALALTSVVACSLALPLPVPATKPGATPFPCQHHACGCRDAESCWRSCCCLTTQEKLAWAERHGVKPPKFVLSAANDGPETKAACCSHKCGLATAEQKHATDDTPSSPSRSPNGAVLLIMALKCRGIHVSVSLMPPSLPVDLGGFADEWVYFYSAPIPGPVLYDPPLQAVATPPPDAFKA
jgi:hypothetical protein